MAKIISLFISQNPDALFYPMYIHISAFTAKLSFALGGNTNSKILSSRS